MRERSQNLQSNDSKTIEKSFNWNDIKTEDKLFLNKPWIHFTHENIFAGNSTQIIRSFLVREKL